MELTPLTAISPIDGRYLNSVEVLSTYFSEYALIRKRVYVEVEYFIELCSIVPYLKKIKEPVYAAIRDIYNNFSVSDARRIKDIEKTTNHDVKAVEYFLREKFELLKLEEYREYIHFGLTSQDINNTAIPLLIKDAQITVLLPGLNKLTDKLKNLALEWQDIPMLARTHGQPATPTKLGKEIMVFAGRLQKQLSFFNSIDFEGKFGGATGNLNAHYVAFSDKDWHGFADKFLERIGLKRQHYTTQIEHYDNLSAYFDTLKRINTILIDLCRDIWMYVSMDYFKQRIIKGEVGSSAMPHKVNPIDFENAEGNLGIANALFEHLSAKLPISRLQRDLTDSTVTRNIGVPVAHTLIALKSINKGMDKLIVNEAKIAADLDQNWAIIAEAIQTILRREHYPDPYNALKELTRNNQIITRQLLHDFIDKLSVSKKIKEELKYINPRNYSGK